MAKIKYKERILKVTREKQPGMYKETPIRLSAVFSVENLQARREWHDVFKMMTGKNLHPERLSFRFEGEIKSLVVLKEFSTTKLVLQEMLKGLL